MHEPLLQEPARLGRRPLYSMLAQFPAVLFTGALATDLAYWKTAEFMWETFSVWLLAAGCLLAVPAGLVGLGYFVGQRRLRAGALAWIHAAASLAAVALSVANAFVHSRDGYTAVVPDGLTLSAAAVLSMAVAAWAGWTRPLAAARSGAAA
ncbi:MAG: DUF2231 domain-containing protein [Burkholderiaceae bacterium]